MTNIPSLNSTDLLAIVAIAEYGSLVAASVHLQTSQSALSRTVSRVERVVGVKLFERSTRRVQATPAGREFVSVAERILGDLQLALGNMRDVATEQRGQVIVSTFPVHAMEALPALVRSFRESRPHVHVRIRTGRNPEVLEDVTNGTSDFGVTYGDVPNTVERIEVKQQPICVIFPSDHALARTRGPIRLEQLRDVLQVSLPRESHTRRIIDGAAAAQGIGLRHTVTVPGFLEIISYVRAGVGAGMLPRSVLPRIAPAGVVIRPLIAPVLSLSLGLVSLRNRHLSPAASSFRSLILEELRSNGKPSPKLGR